jgi:hypothetical protein
VLIVFLLQGVAGKRETKAQAKRGPARTLTRGKRGGKPRFPISMVGF